MHLTSRLLTLLDRLSSPVTVHALATCRGVYDPAQARIEAESVKATMEKFNASTDDAFKTRAILIKEERATSSSTTSGSFGRTTSSPSIWRQVPALHNLFWTRPRAAGEAKKTTDAAVGQKPLDQIAEIDRIFGQTRRPTSPAVGACRSSALSARHGDRSVASHPPETGGSTATSSSSPTGSSWVAGSPFSQIAL